MISPGRAANALADLLVTGRVLAQSGLVRPYSPLTLARLGKTMLDWGVGPAGGFQALAQRNPDGLALVDELGELTFREVDNRGTALADSLRRLGVRAGDGVAIMVRNHRGFTDATLAAAKLGADMLYLNTAFSGPQLVEVLEREQPLVVVHDEEFTELLSGADGITRVVSWQDSEEPGVATVEQLIAEGSREAGFRPPRQPGRIVILTSGTTGTPKGAPRERASVDAAVALLSRMPLRHGWTTHIAAPLFHTWGWAHLAMAMLLESTVVLRRTFDPETCLATCVEHDVDSLVVIPVMMQRMLKLPAETLEKYDLSSVKVVAASGSALPGDLGVEWMDRFGDTLYNMYGSTEVAYATVATPRDLREAPGTAGRPVHATTVRIYDDHGTEVRRGQTGRIFVGNTLLFPGYTGGGHKETIDGLMSTGDVGHFDEQGRLFIDGRDDEMIVSGGENVFPAEVEDCLYRHPAVLEAAAVGLSDDHYGQRLRAFVVLHDGASVSEADLKEHVKGQLARFKVPREIVFLDALPRTATGKLLKRNLPTDSDEGL